jgi:hypothetical protein
VENAGDKLGSVVDIAVVVVVVDGNVVVAVVEASEVDADRRADDWAVVPGAEMCEVPEQSGNAQDQVEALYRQPEGGLHDGCKAEVLLHEGK